MNCSLEWCSLGTALLLSVLIIKIFVITAVTLETEECCRVVEAWIGRGQSSVPQKVWVLDLQLSSCLSPCQSWIPPCRRGAVGPEGSGCEDWVPLLLIPRVVATTLSWHALVLKQISVLPACVCTEHILSGPSVRQRWCALESRCAHLEVKASLCSSRSSSSPLSLLCYESTSRLKINTLECSKI